MFKSYCSSASYALPKSLHFLKLFYSHILRCATQSSFWMWNIIFCLLVLKEPQRWEFSSNYLNVDEKWQKLQIDPRLPCGMQAFSILSEPTGAVRLMHVNIGRWNSRRTLGGKEKKGGSGVTATPHYSASADWLHFTCSTSKSQIANLLFTRSPLWHEGTNLPGQKKSRCVVYLESAMFHLLLTLGDIYFSSWAIFNGARHKCCVFWCLQKHRDLRDC